MKYVVVVLCLLLSFSAVAAADELQVKTREVNGNTVITCHIPPETGKIDMAYIKFNSDNEKSLPGGNCDMEIIDDNNAIYTVPGVHQVIEGKVQIFLFDLSKDVIKKDFVIRK
jgi:hypothetical protein